MANALTVVYALSMVMCAKGTFTEVHHHNGDKHDNKYEHLLLFHADCHDEVHG